MYQKDKIYIIVV